MGKAVRACGERQTRLGMEAADRIVNAAQICFRDSKVNPVESVCSPGDNGQTWD